MLPPLRHFNLAASCPVFKFTAQRAGPELFFLDRRSVRQYEESEYDEEEDVAPPQPKAREHWPGRVPGFAMLLTIAKHCTYSHRADCCRPHALSPFLLCAQWLV
jgi:hypothetical protein